MPIRLDASLERPWQRTGFKHPKLLRWTRSNRAKLIWAVLTLVQAWIAAGRPAGKESLGSYESWAEVTRGILAVAGIPGFLGNLDEAYSEADQEVLAWGEFFDAWWEVYRDRLVASDDLFNVATQRRTLMDVWAGHSEQSGRIRLGKALSRMRDRVIRGYRMRRAGVDSRGGVNKYRLETLTKAADITLSPGVAGVVPLEEMNEQDHAVVPAGRAGRTVVTDSDDIPEEAKTSATPATPSNSAELTETIPSGWEIEL